MTPVLALAALLLGAPAPSSARLVLPDVTSWTPPDFYHDKEGPIFRDVTPKRAPYDAREYEKSHWAEYNAGSGTGFVVAEGKAYTQLVRYFKGANTKDRHLDLTTPAVTKFVPTDADFSGSRDNYTVGFYLPHTGPEPQVDGVRLASYPSTTFYVRSFGGYASEGNILQEAKTLRDQLRHDEVDAEDKWFLFATYDSAARLFDRHNEVWFKAEGSRLPKPLGEPLGAAQEAAESAALEVSEGVHTLYQQLKKALLG